MPRDYETLFPAFDAYILRDADEAITDAGMWEWLKTFEPKKDEGFMFTLHPNINEISLKMKYDDHTGFTFAWCMRNMEAVAKKGWDKYRADILESRLGNSDKLIRILIETLESSSDPNKQKQALAMKEFQDGKISETELRTLFG